MRGRSKKEVKFLSIWKRKTFVPTKHNVENFGEIYTPWEQHEKNFLKKKASNFASLVEYDLVQTTHDTHPNFL